VPEVTSPSGRSSRRSALGRRFFPPLLAAAVFGAMWLLFLLGYRDLYYAIYLWWGFFPFPDPFMDTAAVLMAIDCHRAGVDIWHANPCMNGGWYTYSPFLLRTAALPLGQEMTIPIGMGFVVLFLLSHLVLPASRDWKETAIRCVALLSTGSAFAIERGNLDLALYAMATIGAWLLIRPPLRWMGYGTFVLAALLKFYPVTLLVLAVRERHMIAVITGAAAGAALVLLVAISAGEMRAALGVTPIGWPFGDVFGALNLPYGIFVVPSLPAGSEIGPEIFRAPLPWQAWTILAVLLVFAGYVAASHLRRDRSAWRGLDDGRAVWLAAGAVVIIGCFFAAQNVAYRTIFLLLTLPGLYALMAGDRSGLGGYRSVIVAALFVLWQELPHRLVTRIATDSEFGSNLHLLYWAARELIWWWLVARLISLVAAFLLSSPALTPISSLADRLLPWLREPDDADRGPSN